MTVPCAVGVDNGGTWIRLVGLNRKGQRVWSLTKNSPTVKNLPSFLQKHLARFAPLNGLAVGSRGIWKTSARRSLRSALRNLARNVLAVSDVEAAWLSAFKRQGIVVIAGTGSIAYGRTASGRFSRAGGLGPKMGDEGSGYWIAKEWLERQGRAVRFSASEVRRIAAMAPDVFRRAERGDRSAQLVVRYAQWELAALVKVLARQLGWSSVPVALAGSVFQNPAFRQGFLRALAPLKARLVRAKLDSATALARSIM